MKTTVLLHADEIARVLDRLACQIMERHGCLLYTSRCV